jgi:hypothetical protein
MALGKRRHADTFPLPQPNLDAPVLLSALLGLVGSDWRFPSESIHKRRFDASHLQLVGDCSGTFLGKRIILSGPAGSVGKTEQQDIPLLVRWSRKHLYQTI